MIDNSNSTVEQTVEEMLKQLSAVTIRFFRETSIGMEPREFLDGIETIRKLLELQLKIKEADKGDKHLHLHLNAAEMLVNKILGKENT